MNQSGIISLKTEVLVTQLSYSLCMLFALIFEAKLNVSLFYVNLHPNVLLRELMLLLLYQEYGGYSL